MSGGSFDYFYYQLDLHAYDFKDLEIRNLMIDLAALHHDLDWFVSGGYSEERYQKSLAEFKKKWFQEPREIRLKEYIDEKFEKLNHDVKIMIGE